MDMSLFNVFVIYLQNYPSIAKNDISTFLLRHATSFCIKNQLFELKSLIIIEYTLHNLAHRESKEDAKFALKSQNYKKSLDCDVNLYLSDSWIV